MSMLNVLSCKSAFVIELFYWLVMIIAFDHRLLLLRCHPSHWPGRMQVLMTPVHIPWNLRLRPVQCHILLWDSFVIAAFVNRVMITMSLSRYLTIWSNTKHAHATQPIYTCIHTLYIRLTEFWAKMACCSVSSAETYGMSAYISELKTLVSNTKTNTTITKATHTKKYSNCLLSIYLFIHT